MAEVEGCGVMVDPARYLERDWKYVDIGASGTGSAGTLPMTDEEKKAASKRKRFPLGFVAEETQPKGKPRKKSAA